MRVLTTIPLVALCLVAPSSAQTIYPIDRADILAGSLFDFKVEFPELQTSNSAAVTINGRPYANTFGRDAIFIEREDGKDQSALVLRDVSLRPGTYEVRAGASSVIWNVYATGPRKAKNVILFIGDGMSPAHRIAARLSALSLG